MLPPPPQDAEAHSAQVRCFDDLYGFRAGGEGASQDLLLLSPWEFLMLWEVCPLPEPKSPEARIGRNGGVGG